MEKLVMDVKLMGKVASRLFLILVSLCLISWICYLSYDYYLLSKDFKVKSAQLERAQAVNRRVIRVFGELKKLNNKEVNEILGKSGLSLKK